MRLLLPLLLLSSATSALALPTEDGDAHDARAARFEQRQARPEQAQPRFERPAPQVAQPQASPAFVARPQGSFDRPERRFDGGRPSGFDGGARWRDRRAEQPQGVSPTGVSGAAARPSGDSVADWRWRERRGGERPGVTAPAPSGQVDGVSNGAARYGWSGRDSRRDGGTWTGRTARDGRIDRVGGFDRDGRYGRVGVGDRRADTGAYRPDWRRDPRYDWQRYRDRNRSAFHLGIYVDPFGWGYRPLSIGWQLPVNYYAQQYWLGDPGYYSLPVVGWPYQWVRYYDDALLIDVRDGRVVDVINAFFW